MSSVATAVVGGALVGGIASNRAAGKAANASDRASNASIDEQRRQFDLQRRDAGPYRQAGMNALNVLQQRLGTNQPLMGGNNRKGISPGANRGSPNFQTQIIDEPSNGLPDFNYQGTQPEFNFNGGNPEFNYTGQRPEGNALPEFGGRDRFNFNLEEDQGYQFARDQAIKAANREGAGSGKYGSGSRLAEISDRVTGIASQYANDAYGRQMGASRENYGRGVSEYGMDYGRAQDMYGREVDREASGYGRAKDAYGRDINADATNYMRSQDAYGRGVNQEANDYSRALTGYGLDYQKDQDLYGRELNLYNQDQNYLNRLSSMAGFGQTANQSSADAGSNMANSIANINMANAQAQGNAANTKYSGLNNAIQGGIGNFLTYQGLQNPYQTQIVDGDAYQPSQMYNRR